MYVTQQLARLLDAAEREATRLKDEYVSVEHLIIALLDESQDTTVGRILHEHRLTRDRFLQALTDSGQPARHLREPGGRLRGAGEVWT